jgi:hypothetical protein
MAKRVIQECDLTKQEYDPDETVIITIKKKGKTKGRTYDLSPSAAAKLEQQLVAGSDAALGNDWAFFKVPSSPTPPQLDNNTVFGDQANDGIEDDSDFVAAKKKELRQEGIIGSEEEERELATGPVSEAVGAVQSKCSHLNKSGIKVSSDHKKYRTCNSCNKTILEHSSKDRQDYMNTKAPKG